MDNSIFTDGKRHIDSFDDGFNDTAPLTRTNDTHANSIHEVMKKRLGSTERTRVSRPRSSKGNRNLQSQTNSHSAIPKIAHNRSEERNLKSQGGARVGSSQNSSHKRSNIGSHNNSILMHESQLKHQSFGLPHQQMQRNMEPSANILNHLMPVEKASQHSKS
jgi:hypothetical protein